MGAAVLVPCQTAQCLLLPEHCPPADRSPSAPDKRAAGFPVRFARQVYGSRWPNPCHLRGYDNPPHRHARTHCWLVPPGCPRGAASSRCEAGTSVSADGVAVPFRGRRDGVSACARGCAHARAARHSAGPAPPPVVLRRLQRARLHHGHRRTADVSDLPALFSRDVGMGAGWAAASGQVLSGLVVMHDAECTMHNRIAQPRGRMRNSRGRAC